MGRDLIEWSPVFRQALERCDEILGRLPNPTRLVLYHRASQVRGGAALLGARTRLKKSRERELEALIAPEVRAAIAKNGIELVNYPGLSGY